MSNMKSKTIGNISSAVWILSITMLVNAVYVKINSKQPLPEMIKNVKLPLDDFKTEAEVYSEEYGTLRLKITWKMTNESVYDVTVRPLTESDPWCTSVEWCHRRNQITENGTLFAPETPINVDETHSHLCEITPGCSYSVLVESISFESESVYTVPDPVGNIYSCKHVFEFPNVTTSGVIDSQIMTLTWKITGDYNTFGDVQLFLMIIITNADDYRKVLQFFNHALDDSKQRSGQFKWNIPTNETVYQIKTFVFDSNYCESKIPDVTTVRAPPEPAEQMNYKDDRYYAHVVWLKIAVSASVIIIIIIASYMCFNKVKPTQPKRPGEMSMELIPINELYEIPHSSLELLKKVGQGAFGLVYLARAENICGRPGFQYVAVKQLKDQPDEEEKDEFFREIQTMKVVPRHPNIVRLFGVCTVEEPLQIVMEYVGCGDLLNYLHKARAKHEQQCRQNQCEPDLQLLYLDLINSSTSTSDSSHKTEMDGINIRPSVTETMYTMLSQHESHMSSTSLEYELNNRELHDFANQIAKGMRHLHTLEITHRDLAARNILIDEHKVLKISDFGLSRYGIYHVTRGIKVPWRWLSIEALRNQKYSDKSDVWAFGIVLWEIGTLGALPYHSLNTEELIPFLTSGARLEKPANCSEYLYELMLDCWAYEADDRPDFEEILSKLEPEQQTLTLTLNSYKLRKVVLFLKKIFRAISNRYIQKPISSEIFFINRTRSYCRPEHFSKMDTLICNMLRFWIWVNDMST